MLLFGLEINKGTPKWPIAEYARNCTTLSPHEAHKIGGHTYNHFAQLGPTRACPPLTESDAKKILLTRAFEQPLTEPWTAVDQAWASDETSRSLGDSASYEAWLVTRADLATARLNQRLPAIAGALTSIGRGGWLLLLPALAFLLGLATDAIGSAQRVNMLAPPLLALILWNLVVYAILAASTLLTSISQNNHRPVSGPIRHMFEQITRHGVERLGNRFTKHDSHAAIVRFLSSWSRASESIQTARLAKLLHQASIALTAGILISLYVRGLAFEYRAGWDSTFLTPETLHTFLSWILGPAAQLSGQALPSVPELAQLRFSVGPGENAARWIHLYALTAAVLVLLPRAVLAYIAARRVRQLENIFNLPLDEVYFQRLRPSHTGKGTSVLVLPYSYHLSSEALAGLKTVLEFGLGSGIELRVSESIPLGGEDELERWLPQKAEDANSPAMVPIFSLTATPERENQGALLEALIALSKPRQLGLVLIDESGFRQRFVGPEGRTRLMQRRESWQRLLHDYDIAPVFVDLVSPDLDALASDMHRIHVHSQ